jgi:alanine racemase
VTLIGGDAGHSVAAVSAHAARSPYEVLTGLHARCQRSYVNAAAQPSIGAAA